MIAPEPTRRAILPGLGSGHDRHAARGILRQDGRQDPRRRTRAAFFAVGSRPYAGAALTTRAAPSERRPNALPRPIAEAATERGRREATGLARSDPSPPLPSQA